MPWISLLLGLLLSAFIIALVIFQTDFFAVSTSRTLSRYFFGGTRFELGIEKMSGNPLRGITVRGLSIRYEGPDFSFDVLRIEEIWVKYSVLSLVRREPVIDELRLVDPHVWIKPDSAGVGLLPAVGGGGGRGALPRLAVKDFLIQGGQVILQGRERADVVKDISLGGKILSDHREVTLEISEANARNPGRDAVVNGVAGTVRWVREERGSRRGSKPRQRLYLQRLAVDLEESSFVLDGSVDPDSMSYHVKVDAASLNIEELTRIAGVETSHVGEIQGTFVLRGGLSRADVNGFFEGVFSGYALSDFSTELVIDSRSIRINRAHGRLNGAIVDGDGFYSFEGQDRFVLDLNIDDLDLSKGFVPGKNLPATSFSGGMNLNYLIDREDVLFTFDLDEGHFRDFPFERAYLVGSYMEDTLHMERIYLSHPTHIVNSHGWITDDSQMRFFIDLSGGRTDTLFSYLGIERYRADIEMNCVWEGDPDRWRLHASGTCGDFRYDRAVVTSGDLKLAVMKNEDYSVFVELTGDSCYIDPVGFSGLELSLEHDGEVTSFKRIRLRRDGMEADMIAELTGAGDSTKIRFTEVDIAALQQEWKGGGNFTVTLVDSIVIFDDLQLHSRLGALYAGGSYIPERRMIEAGCRFERLGLSLLNTAGVVEKPLSGKGKGSVEISGSLDDPALEIALAVEEVAYDTLSIDTLIVAGGYADRRHRIDSVVVSSPLGFLHMSGDLTGASAFHVVREGKRALAGAEASLTMYCWNLNVEPFYALVGDVPLAGGVFSGAVTVSDSLVHPSVVVNGRVNELRVSAFTVPSLNLNLDVGGSGIVLSGTLDSPGGVIGSVSGTIPLRPAAWFYSLGRDDTMTLELSVQDGDFTNASRITDLFAESSGRYSVELAVRGTTGDPRVRGEFGLRDAGFRLAGMEESYYGVNAVIALEDTVIKIREISGREGKKGKFRSAGWISFREWKPARYELDVRLEGFTLLSIPDVMAILDGMILVRTAEIDGREIPVITGSLDVKNAEIYYGFDDFAGAQPTATLAPPSYLAEIDLKIPGNTWLRAPDANIEMRGDITLIHDHRGTYLRGSLALVRGWYNIYNNKFRIRSGSLDFVRAEGMRPVIDVEAETNDPEGRKIYLTLAWHQDDVEPRLSLRHEDPGYSETDIWKMLGGGVVGASNGEASSWDAISTAQNIAANYIERMLNSQMQGVTFEVESAGGSTTSGGTMEEKETMIAVGKYLSEGLYVKYRQGLSISSAKQIEVEYRISDLFLVRSEIIRYSEKVLQQTGRRSTDEINVDVKLRWEF